MSQNPYAQHDPMSGEGAVDAPERTSLLAILSLVCSLLCCLSPVGVLLGIFALIGIGASGGRVKGQGIAVAGLIIGLIFSVLLGFVIVGATQMGTMFGTLAFKPVGDFMTAVESGDNDAARAGLVPPLDSMSDGELEAFRAAYTVEAGAFISVPEDLFKSFELYSQISNDLQNYQGGQNQIPVPATFANGTRLIVLEIDPSANTQPSTGPNGIPILPVQDLIFIQLDGTEVRLSDFDGPDAAIPPVEAPAEESEGQDATP